MSARDDLTSLLVHAVTVETADGTDSHGRPHYADPVAVAGFLDGPSRSVGGDAWAAQTTGEARLYVGLADGARFETGSRVTGPHGDTWSVAGRTWHESGTLDLPDHVEVALS